MAARKQKRKPGPESGYREQHDPRGQPGQHQTRDGKRLPEEADRDQPKPREPATGAGKAPDPDKGSA